ncbi:MAG TPA: excinuclease ABC subunit UvrA [Thermoanaerobaculia bacterium]|nr:excinuclease ABC subunit UvrA [Thermoanaerobaculia bacterium]
MPPRKFISIRGARTHNLKEVSVDLPHGQITVVTGPSGSGKSSLAFNTLYAEGQRRFVESMSTYVRQFLERMERPDVDSIDGILPAIAVEQKNSVKNARSTVATATELADHMRLFMAYCGETFCPNCEHRVRRESPSSIAEHVLRSFAGRRIMILAPLLFEAEHRIEVLKQLMRAGFYRAWIENEVIDLKSTDTTGATSLELVIGRYQIEDGREGSITEGIEQAFELSKGSVNILEQTGDTWLSHRFTSRFTCDRCGTEFPDPTPHLFSFNSPLGACELCQGYGRVIGIDMSKVIPARSQRLDEMPISPWNSPGYESSYDDLEKAAKKYKLRLDVPIDELTAEEWNLLYEGRGKWYGIKGFFDWLETKKYKIHVRVKLAKYRSYDTCTDCDGSRLKPAARNVRFRDRHIGDIFAMNVGDARRFWEYLPLSRREEEIAGHLRREILNRLVYLDEVGLSYLTLDRQTRTLSGGEAQRINLAAALGSALTQTLYVIDEPTIGLHARDSERLLAVLRRLSDAGNSVVVVEHDPSIIGGGDYVVELGPGAGELGGDVVFAGPIAHYRTEIVERTSGDSTNVLESGDGTEKPAPSRVSSPESIRITGAREHNLKNIDVTIPLNRMVAVTGVSGSGKSTLIRDCLHNGYQRTYRAATKLDVGQFTSIEGVEQIDDMQFVDQSPIGRSSRSNPATYVKAWDEIRKLLASTTSAKLQGVAAGMFSFNTSGGRCDACEGAGFVTIDMQFLADIEVVCEKCGGKRFNDQVLKVSYKTKNVEGILAMTVDEAAKFFVDKRPILKRLAPLRSVGLGYLRLGQSTASLSGGEAQRLKLASFLASSEKALARRLFLFDEPTTGLHASDITQLIRTFRELIERGSSVVVIEHNIQMIEACDYIIDIGPEGGDAGGHVIATGTPEEIARNAASITGRYLFEERARTIAEVSEVGYQRDSRIEGEARHL